MHDQQIPLDPQTLIAETRRIWDAKATFWDEQMGEGNAFHRELVGPAVERLLAVQVGEQVLDVACGNGQFARRLAQLGAHVVATDFSAQFLERPQARTTKYQERIAYRLIDATDEAQLLTLGKQRFDAAVCNMALMDMPVIEPLLRALGRLIKAGGRFVFAVQHPCFNSSAAHLVAEQREQHGQLVVSHAMQTTAYLQVPPQLGPGMPGEPEPHYYFHRPLSELFKACLGAGFVLDGIEEPAFKQAGEDNRLFSWANLPGIPPVLVARLRLQEASSNAHKA